MNVRYLCDPLHFGEAHRRVAYVFQLFRSHSDVPIAEVEASFWLIKLMDRINGGQSLQRGNGKVANAVSTEKQRTGMR